MKNLIGSSTDLILSKKERFKVNGYDVSAYQVSGLKDMETPSRGRTVNKIPVFHVGCIYPPGGSNRAEFRLHPSKRIGCFSKVIKRNTEYGIRCNTDFGMPF